MKKYRVTVEGTSYEVEIEEIKNGDELKNKKEVKSPEKAKKAKAKPAPKSVKKEVKEEITAPVVEMPLEGELSINAPMPGTILKVNVEVGQLVKSGEVLLILEAMKMENEIMAPKDGIVKSVSVIKGSTVTAGGLMVIIK